MRLLAATAVAVLAASALLAPAEALYFFIEEGSERCFLEMVPEETRVVATYKSPDWNPTGDKPVGIRATITDPHKSVVVDRMLGGEGRLALETYHGGEYTLCFATNSTDGATSRRRFRFDIRVDVGEMAIDYDTVAQREHLDTLSVEIRKLSDKLEDIMNLQSFQREREVSFRESSDETYQQLQWWSLLQTFVLVVSAVWQLLHIKAYVLRKKTV